jgi:hypothetical protein
MSEYGESKIRNGVIFRYRLVKIKLRLWRKLFVLTMLKKIWQLEPLVVEDVVFEYVEMNYDTFQEWSFNRSR